MIAGGSARVFASYSSLIAERRCRAAALDAARARAPSNRLVFHSRAPYMENATPHFPAVNQ